MKFSEYIVLGSTFVEFDSTVYLQNGCGCLIGMAAAAKTGRTTLPCGTAFEVFPWLNQIAIAVCPICRTTWPTYGCALSCLAAHVEHDDCTFEKALEYVRSVEPGDEEETVPELKSQTAFGMLCPEGRTR